MNPLVLALVGLPFFAGFIMRFACYKRESFCVSLALWSQVMLVLGIGYAFMTYKAPNPLFIENADGMCLVAVFWIPILCLWVTALSEGVGCCSAYCGFYFIMGILIVLLSILETLPDRRPIAAAAAVSFFICLGSAHALLGPIASGFSISAAAVAYFTTGTLQNISLWKYFFELLNIETNPMKLVVLGVAVAAGLAEPTHKLYESIFGPSSS